MSWLTRSTAGPAEFIDDPTKAGKVNDVNDQAFASILADLERKIARHKFRFAVGAPNGQHSGVWLAGAYKSEFYVGALGMMGNSKISLHGSLRCRLALYQEHVDRMRQQGLQVPPDRALIKWTREPAPAEGAYPAVILSFPTDYLARLAPEGAEAKPVFLFDAAPPGKAIEFGVFFSRESAATLEPKFLQSGAHPLCTWTLANGETVWLVSQAAGFDPRAIPPAEMWSATMQPLDRDSLPCAGDDQRNLNALLWNSPKVGEPLTVIEIGGVAMRTTRAISADGNDEY